MTQDDPSSTAHVPPAAGWLQGHAHILFAAVRRVVPDSLCAYDIGLELAALVGHRWECFDAGRDGTRVAWALRLAAELVDRAATRGAVPTSERHRGVAAPAPVALSSADLDRLSELAHAPLELDGDDAAEALAAMERAAPSPGALSRLAPSTLVDRSPSEAHQEDR